MKAFLNYRERCGLRSWAEVIRLHVEKGSIEEFQESAKILLDRDSLAVLQQASLYFTCMLYQLVLMFYVENLWALILVPPIVINILHTIEHWRISKYLKFIKYMLDHQNEYDLISSLKEIEMSVTSVFNKKES